MIREIACDIKDIIMATGYVMNHYEYVELVRQDQMTYPGYYIGGGNYEQVLNPDMGGMSYLRKNGNVSFGSVTMPKFVACGGNPFVKMTMPFRLVMAIDKDKLGDDAFSDDLLAQNIIKVLSQAVSAAIYGVQSLEYEVTGYNTDSLSVWSDEVKGMDYQMNFRYSFISISFNAVSIVNPACLTEICNPY